MSFVDWVESELLERDWTRADLARAGDLTTAQVSRVLNRQQNAGYAFCQGVAKAFSVPVEVVYAKAGLLPEQKEEDAWVDEMSHILKKLPNGYRDAAEILIKGLYEKDRRALERKMQKRK